MKKSQMIRIVEFDRLVRDTVYPNRMTFSVEYGVSERTVARDIEYLRDRLHAPLEYDWARRGYYYRQPWDISVVITTTVAIEDHIENLIEQMRQLNAKDREMVIQLSYS